MRRHLHYSMAIMSCALWTFACGSNSGARRDDASSGTPVGSQGRQETVRLSGCVEMAGMADYVLQRLHIEGNDPQAAPRTTVNSAPAGITEGSWVRLTGTRDLPSLVGHRVMVTGVVADTGRNTTGTGGVSSGGNGTAPEIKVAEIKDLGEGCHEASGS